MDSAYPCNKYLFLIRSEKITVDITTQDINISKEAMTMHQLAECGMRDFQASFPSSKIALHLCTEGNANLQ